MPNFRPSWTDSQLAMWTHPSGCQALSFARGRSDGLDPIGPESSAVAAIGGDEFRALNGSIILQTSKMQ
jgi:hypothetical protein